MPANYLESLKTSAAAVSDGPTSGITAHADPNRLREKFVQVNQAFTAVLPQLVDTFLFSFGLQ